MMGSVRTLSHLKGISNSCNHFIFCRTSSLPSNKVPCTSVRSYRTSLIRHSRWQSRPGGGKKNTNTMETPFEGVLVESGPVRISNLWKPLGFTICFSTVSFAGAAIWQYENMRWKVMSLVNKHVEWLDERFLGVRKRGSWRHEAHKWWSSLTEGQKLFIPICFANCLVFLAWRLPQLQGTMVRYFCSNPASRILCWPMILSTFSHYSALHLLANMYVLHSFSSGAVSSLGKEQFMGLYLSAGVISSLTSYLHKAVTNKPGLSLGASGAIMAVLGYVCTEYPETRLSIILLPFYTFDAGTAIKVVLALDTAGVLMGWKIFDHAAHLGGALCGIAWSYWGNDYIWQKREPLLHWWHELRGPPSQ